MREGSPVYYGGDVEKDALLEIREQSYGVSGMVPNFFVILHKISELFSGISSIDFTVTSCYILEVSIVL